MSKKEFKHGTRNGYSYRRCRCKLCVEANADYKRQYTVALTLDDPRHGTHWGYQTGCRCLACSNARKHYHTQYRKSMTPDIIHGRTGYYRGCRCLVCKKAIRAYYTKRRRTDPLFKLVSILRVRFRHALHAARIVKHTHVLDIVGCTPLELKEYLARQFSPGMSWDNLGAWQVDHIRPCASFDLTDPEQQRACFHYSNLQPLWAKDNRAKWHKYIPLAP